MEISHLAAKPQLEPVSRYVFSFENARGHMPERVLLADSDFGAIVKVVRASLPAGSPIAEDTVTRAARYQHHLTFRGVPIVSIREGMKRA